MVAQEMIVKQPADDVNLKKAKESEELSPRVLYIYIRRRELLNFLTQDGGLG